MSEARTRRNSQFQSSIFESSSISQNKSTIERESFNNRQLRQRSCDSLSLDYGRSQPRDYRNVQGNDYTYYDSSKTSRNKNQERQFGVQNSNQFEYEDSNSRPSKPSDTPNLLGNDQNNYYQKENIRKTSRDFEPKYSETSAFNRKYSELYGSSQHIKQLPKKEENNTERRGDVSSRQRKRENMESTIFYPSQYKDFERENPQETRKTQFSPESRRLEMRESSIFGKQEPRQAPSQQHDTYNEEKRRKNHMYSDIFGEPSEYAHNKCPDKLIAATQKWTENDARTYTREEDYDAQKFKSKNLWGNEDYQERNITPQPNRADPQNPLQFKNREMASSMQNYSESQGKTQEPAIVEYDLENLPRNITKEGIKKICSSVHVVSIQIDDDNITGTCKGNGKIVIRTSTNAEKDLKRLQLDLADENIALKTHKENLGLKSNYSQLSSVKWNDPHIARDPSENSIKRKESHNRKPVDEIYMANMQWQRTKNPKHEYK
ncbi:unnamed protein product [Blepharisma stoltei]|uniref:Uncharacterized protein n=1 Tax=Blepharisma stoltei TaxID=1481888 RepID=A0AAU9JS48_9CILI|nr:unnamed protein product [Blepharisma stoltei]